MLVENKPGAGGNLGAEAAIKSPPDGYTYLTISGSYAINSILHKPSFDSLNDIVAIGQFTDEPRCSPSIPRCRRKTLGELVALCKREPGKLSYGSSGPGGLLHLGTEFFLDAAGIKATHVPYRGTAPALADLLAGNVQILTGGVDDHAALHQERQGARAGHQRNQATGGRAGHPVLHRAGLSHAQLQPVARHDRPQGHSRRTSWAS